MPIVTAGSTANYCAVSDVHGINLSDLSLRKKKSRLSSPRCISEGRVSPRCVSLFASTPVGHRLIVARSLHSSLHRSGAITPPSDSATFHRTIISLARLYFRNTSPTMSIRTRKDSRSINLKHTLCVYNLILYYILHN